MNCDVKGFMECVRSVYESRVYLEGIGVEKKDYDFGNGWKVKVNWVDGVEGEEYWFVWFESWNDLVSVKGLMGLNRLLEEGDGGVIKLGMSYEEGGFWNGELRIVKDWEGGEDGLELDGDNERLVFVINCVMKREWRRK
jgi:hypothetical protein